MAYRNNDSGCGCIFIAVLLIFAAMVSGIRDCVNGDIKLPKFGSSHVSGGSGNYGTSNGYNVKYKQTTDPNADMNLKDFTNTNNQSTDYREGRNMQHPTTNSVVTSPSHSVNGNSSSNTIIESPKTYYRTCDRCNGTGKRNTFYWFNENVMGSSCIECGRTDTPRHDKVIECEACSGQGKIKMERVNGPLGEMEIRVYE